MTFYRGRSEEIMSQLTRGQLKGLVKECLVEILSEGLLGNKSPSPPSPERRDPKPQSIKDRIPLRSQSPALSTVSFGGTNSSKRDTSDNRTNKLKESAVRSHVSSITSDPIMSQIFEDTANSTLQEQIYAERSPGGRHPLDSETESSSSFSDEILSESAKNWSSIAFSESPRNR